METKYNRVLFLFILLFALLGCSNHENEYRIINNSYKGLGVFLYYEIDGGSLYEVKFIPFHFNNEKIEKAENLSLNMIYSKSDNIVFERGLSFGSFRDRNGVLYDIFKNSKSCGDINYCFVYIDFKESEQDKVDKWYNRKGYSSKVCVGDKDFKVIYDPTQIYIEDLINIKTLNIIK